MKKVINQVFITILLLTGVFTCHGQNSNVSIETTRSYGQISIDFINHGGDATDLNYIVIQDNILMFTSGDVTVPPHSTSSVTISLHGALQSVFEIQFVLYGSAWNRKLSVPIQATEMVMLN